MWRQKHTDDSGILNAALNAVILFVTFELVRLNRINVHLGAQNLANNAANRENSQKMLEQLEQINKKL